MVSGPNGKVARNPPQRACHLSTIILLSVYSTESYTGCAAGIEQYMNMGSIPETRSEQKKQVGTVNRTVRNTVLESTKNDIFGMVMLH